MNTREVEKARLGKRIRVAAGEIPADRVLKNCRVVNVYTHEVVPADIAFSDGTIAGVGSYQGVEEVDAGGRYALPGFIDSHIHIESSMVTPEEFCRLLVPHGTTTVIADPHEIANVCGLRGLDYMLDAASRVPMDIRYMMPSCVPCTSFEDAGAVITAEEMRPYLEDGRVLGLAEFMDNVGVAGAEEEVLNKLEEASFLGRPIDGHAPGLEGAAFRAYAAAGIQTDHECGTPEEMRERLANGLYVQLRNGSACRNLAVLADALDEYSARRCLLCSDDRQPVSIFAEGDIDGMLRILVEKGIDPITAVQMATLNAAECYGLRDRGAIAPGKKGDVVLVEDLNAFRVAGTWIDGVPVAEDGVFLPEIVRADAAAVRGSVHLGSITPETFRLSLAGSKVHVIDMVPHEVVTRKSVASVQRSEDGDFFFTEEAGICKIAAIARHDSAAGSSTALLRGYGIRAGAVAMTIAHDSHNIIAAGTNNEDLAFAVNALAKSEGGIVLVREGALVGSMPLPIAGLMSDQSGEWVAERLAELHEKAASVLGVVGALDPIMTLCFMALPVIPEIKITNRGLFDVTTWSFLPLEAE